MRSTAVKKSEGSENKEHGRIPIMCNLLGHPLAELTESTLVKG